MAYSGKQNSESDIENELLSLMQLGQYSPGERFGSERSIADSLGVSRSRLRSALSSLERQGRIVRFIGRDGGVAISDGRLERSLNTVESLPEIARRQGHIVTSRLLEFSMTHGLPSDRRQMQLGDHNGIYRVQRVRMLDGVPFMLEDSRFPMDLFPHLERHDLTGSIYEIMIKVYGISRDSAKEILTVENANSNEAKFLEVRECEPLLRISRLTREKHGRIIEKANDRYLASKMRFTLDSHRFVRFSIAQNEISD